MRLDWIGLDWIGLDLDWTWIGFGLDLDWIELKSDWAGLHVDQHQFFRNRAGSSSPPVTSRRSRRS